MAPQSSALAQTSSACLADRRAARRERLMQRDYEIHEELRKDMSVLTCMQRSPATRHDTRQDQRWLVVHK
ncbi:hypothetical protein AC579_4858 [Pseudocercospora musae]|uniref:Uncharacterized protein n=1 Tax=Pseudocercospora musae TaxID=113226 RepID=A0A139IKH5_9PEZI|nr:hypothetical protein AC579_4858 [Pseudocercospora musae]